MRTVAIVYPGVYGGVSVINSRTNKPIAILNGEAKRWQHSNGEYRIDTMERDVVTGRAICDEVETPCLRLPLEDCDWLTVEVMK